MTKTGLLKSTGIISIATAISRVLGFIRDIVIASFFGTSWPAQAFVVAFRISNSLRDLVGEGATNSAIVPVLTEYKTRGDEHEFKHISRVLFNVLSVILTILAVLGIIFSPLIVRLIAPGFVKEPGLFDLTVRLSRLIFPYLILIGLTAYAMGILNTLKHFAVPAFGPCLLNLALIAATLYLCPRIGVYALAIGVLVGGALQLFINIPVMFRKHITFSFRDGFRHIAVKRIGTLLVPRILGSAVYQVNIFVDTIVASLAWIVGAGGVAALYYANRLIQFPLAIFGLAIAQAALPKMSQEYSSGDIGRLKDTLSFSMRVVFLVMIPASIGLAVLGKPIIRILFERGEFTPYSTSITYSALFFYSFGLFAYSGIKILVTCFYSMRDTMTPVKTASLAVLMNIVLNLLLMRPMKLGGIALATSISATFNCVFLYIILRKKIGAMDTRRIINSLLRVLAASVVMGLALAAALARMPGLNITTLFISIIFAAMIFTGAAYLFDVRELKDFFLWISRKR